MIRHTRRASVLIAFCVLISAATASAECAWVLWTERPTRSDQWSLSGTRGAFETKSSGRATHDSPGACRHIVGIHRPAIPQRNAVFRDETI